jgi:cytochrome c1
VRRLALIAVVGALVAGCGGEKTVTPTPETVEGTPPPAQPQAQAKGDPAAGKTVFESNGCGGCHTYQPAGTSGTTGPDLDKLTEFAKTAGKPLDEFVHESIVDPGAYVEKGFPEGVMPTYGQLSDQQVADLVAFLTQPS